MENSKRLLRRNDFRISLILLFLCIFFLFETSSFPMSGTFGGVENQWYVSPALLPLILLVLLIVSSLYVLFRSIKDFGYQDFSKITSWLGSYESLVNRDRWFVILMISIYIYVYIPSVDFYLATVVFILSLYFRFYIEKERLSALLLVGNILMIFYIMGVRTLLSDDFSFFLMQASSNERMIFLSDLGMMLLIFISTMTLVLSQVDFYKIKNVFLLALFLPLVLVSVFNFFLQVPMPVEYGTVIKGLEYIWYDIFNL